MTDSQASKNENIDSFAEKASAYSANCPHLGLLNDPQTCYRSASPRNYCHYVKAVSAIDLDHQEQFCFGDYEKCPVLNETVDTPPSFVKPKINPVLLSRKQLQPILIAVGVVLFLLVTYLIFFQGNSEISSNAEATQALPAVVSTTNLPEDESTPVPTTTPHIVLTLTPEPVEVEATATEEAISVPLSPTPLAIYHGSQMGTPMGAADRYVVHRVAPNESLNFILETYQTSPEAFHYVNQSQNSGGLWIGDILVIPQAITDVNELLPLTAIYIDSYHLVSDVCAENGIEEGLFREINDLDESLQILAPGQWILIPFSAEIGIRRSATPTPIFDDGKFSQKVGPEGEYILHQVTFEDTLNEVAIQHNTTLAVLSKLNDLPEDYVLNLGQIILVQPGLTEIESARNLSVVHLFNSISIEAVSLAFGWDPQVLMTFNGITTGETTVVENQWLIYPEEL